jgi:TniQ
MALPLRVRTIVGEPAHGLLLRLATRHQEADTSAFARELGLKIQRVLAGHDAELLGSLAGVDEYLLSHWTPRIATRSRSVWLAGQELLLNDWSIRRRRWCPHCFVADREAAKGLGLPVRYAAWHRAIWDVQSMSACPVHSVVLRGVCPRCTAAQDWRGPALDRCSCSSDLALGEGSRADSRASAYIGGRLGLTGAPVPLLDALSLRESIWTIEALGRAAVWGYQPARQRLEAVETSAARNVGVDIALGWPETAIRLLDATVRQASQQHQRQGLIAKYGWLYTEWAASPRPLPLRSEMQGLIRDHAVGRGVIAAQETPFGPRFSSALTLTAAAKALPVGYKTAREVIARQGLIPAGSRRGVATHIPQSHLPGIRAQLTKSTAVDIAGLLGIGRGQARALIKGMAPSILPGMSSEAVVDDLLFKLCRLARGTERELPSRGLPLPKACQAAGVSIAEAVPALLVGRIVMSSVDPDAQGLFRVIVSTDMLRSLRPKATTLQICDVASRLAVHPEAVRNLIERGYLSRGDQQGKVDDREVRQFSKRYIRGKDVAAALKTSPKAAVQWLRGWGLEPSIGPPACRAIFFERTRATEYLGALGVSIRTGLNGAPGRCDDH